MKKIKFAAISGIVLLVLSLIMFVLQNFFSGFSLGGVAGMIIGIVLLIIILVLTFFYYKGFVEIAKRTQVRILKFASWNMILFWDIILPLVLIVGLIILLAMAKSFFTPMTLTGNAISMNDLNANVGVGSPLDSGIGESLSLTSSIGAGGWIVIIILVLFVLYYLTIKVLFAIGLIKSGEQVKFAKVAGILDLILTIIFILSLLMILYFLINPFAIFTLGLMFAATAKYLAYGAELLYVVVSVFAILCLFDASKKFDSSELDSSPMTNSVVQKKSNTEQPVFPDKANNSVSSQTTSSQTQPAPIPNYTPPMSK